MTTLCMGDNGLSALGKNKALSLVVFSSAHSASFHKTISVGHPIGHPYLPTPLNHWHSLL